MMKILEWKRLSAARQRRALARPALGNSAEIMATVTAIIADVRSRGDQALYELARKFDGQAPTQLRVSPAMIEAAVRQVPGALKQAIRQARSNIEAFHKAELPQPVSVEPMPGVRCRLEWRAIERVGIYIPGGTAPLFSSILMQAIPARLAGCKRIVLCTPMKNGIINPVILYTAKLCGIDEVYALGGAQAIAAMAYGTASIPKVDKICGPGNQYVTQAKQMVAQDAAGAAIDMPAGPSEVMVMADDSARADWVASDLLAQAEHDEAAQAILLTTNAAFAKAVSLEVDRQLALLSRRGIAATALRSSRILVVDDLNTALEVANTYAPEHLILHVRNARRLVPKISTAGSVFVGALTPESAGDYASGTNHVLPTYGYARAYSGLNVLSFMRSMTVQEISPRGLRALGPAIVLMAEAEGLEAHARAVTIRLET